MSILLPGQAFPAFALPSDDGATVSLADFSGRPLVLFFYPKAGTEACTDEAVAFSALAAAFAAADTALLGISADTPRKLANFRRKYDLAMPTKFSRRPGRWRRPEGGEPRSNVSAARNSPPKIFASQSATLGRC